MFSSLQEVVESHGVEFHQDPVGANPFYWTVDSGVAPASYNPDSAYPTIEAAIVDAAKQFGEWPKDLSLVKEAWVSE